MPLDPGIALGIRPPEMPNSNWVGTMGTMAQIGQSLAQQRIAAITAQQQQLQLGERAAIVQAMRQGGGPGMAQAAPTAQPSPQPQGIEDQIAQMNDRINTVLAVAPTLGPPIAAALREQMASNMSLRSQHLTLQKEALGYAAQSQDLVTRLLSGVQDAPPDRKAAAYTEALAIGKQLNVPGFDRFPATWDDPQAPVMVGGRAAQALSAKERLEAQQKTIDQQIEATKAAATMKTAGAAETQAQTAARAEQRLGGEVTYQPDITGGFHGLPKYPGTAGMPGAAPTGPAGAIPHPSTIPGYAPSGGAIQVPPVVGAGGQPLVSPEMQQKRNEAVNAIAQRYQGHPELATYAEARDAYSNILAADPTKTPGQEAVIANFYRLINPQTPRDVSNAKTAGPELWGTILEQVQRVVGHKITEGTPLSEADMEKIYDAAKRQYTTYDKRYEGILSQHRQLVHEAWPGTNPDLVIRDMRDPQTAYAMSPEEFRTAWAKAHTMQPGITRAQYLDLLQRNGYRVYGLGAKE